MRDEQAERLMFMGERSAEVVHDLKNSLQNIYGYIRLLELKAGKYGENLDSETVLGYCDLIDGEIASASRLTRGFMQNGGIRANLVRQDLNAVVREAVAMMAGRCAVCGVKVVEKPGEGLPEIWLDEWRCRQMIFNLVDNALDAIMEKKLGNGGRNVTKGEKYCGEIRISAELLQDERVLLRVADDGVGMSEEVRRNFLRPFYSTKVDGCGVGGSVVAEVIHQHGGEISVASAVGEGTEVRIFLPVG